jgi:hypothetical protein
MQLQSVTVSLESIIFALNYTFGLSKNLFALPILLCLASRSGTDVADVAGCQPSPADDSVANLGAL